MDAVGGCAAVFGRVIVIVPCVSDAAASLTAGVSLGRGTISWQGWGEETRICRPIIVINNKRALTVLACNKRFLRLRPRGEYLTI